MRTLIWNNNASLILVQFSRTVPNTITSHLHCTKDNCCVLENEKTLVKKVPYKATVDFVWEYA